jgi:hypothetical protein
LVKSQDMGFSLTPNAELSGQPEQQRCEGNPNRRKIAKHAPIGAVQ